MHPARIPARFSASGMKGELHPAKNHRCFGGESEMTSLDCPAHGLKSFDLSSVQECCWRVDFFFFFFFLWFYHSTLNMG